MDRELNDDCRAERMSESRSLKKCATPGCPNGAVGADRRHCGRHQGDPIFTSADLKPTNPKDAEARADNRVEPGLFPDTAVIAGALAMTEGDAKYGGFNYRIAGVRASVYTAALDRHMMAWRNGEDVDPDSGLPHLWKAVACLGVMIDAQECGMLTDDRAPRAPVGQMIRGARHDVARLRDLHKDRTGVRRFTIEDQPEA